MIKMNRRQSSRVVMKDGREPVVAVIIVTWNGKGHTLECLQCVDKLAYPKKKLQLLLVDNGSTDGSQKSIKGFLKRRGKRFLSVRLLELPDNVGAPAAFNRALEMLHPSVQAVWKLDNDVTFEPNYLSMLVKATGAYERVGAVGGRILGVDGAEHEVGAAVRRGPRRWMSTLEYVTARELNINGLSVILGTSCLFPRNVFDRVGLFDEDFFLYYDDTEFCLRLKNHGLGLYVEPLATVIHHRSTSVGRESKIRLSYMVRNHLLLGRRVFHGWDRAAFFGFQIVTFPWRLIRIMMEFRILGASRAARYCSIAFWQGLRGRTGKIVFDEGSDL